MSGNLTLEDVERVLISEIKAKLGEIFNESFLNQIFFPKNCFKCFWLKKLGNDTIAGTDTIWINLTPEKDNNLQALQDFKDRFGIYFFLKEDKIKYIGSSFKGKHSLYFRIQKQLNVNNSNANFVRNIKEVKEERENLTKEKLKELILEETTTICVCSLVNKEEWDKKSQYLILTLENALIYSFNPPFNK